jgi:mono/diheme cytochrome c family protein
VSRQRLIAARLLLAMSVALLLLLVAGAAAVIAFNRLDETPAPVAALDVAVAAGGLLNAAASTSKGQSLVEQGAYLARAGNCAGCHTARGGAAYAGGVALATPFGTVYSSNLTADAKTGIGAWSAEDFWRAIHNGRSRDGHLLTPVFPYTSYTLVTRADSDALFAFLQSQAPVAAAPPPNALRFPYNTQAALAVWRAMYFRPGQYQPQQARGAEWNRGAYLVQGLGHCAACHSQRNALGAIDADGRLGGGMIPMQGWYAPSLRSAGEAGVSGWPVQDVAALLGTGLVDHGAHQSGVQGPMADVVFGSLQYLREPDLHAMATYLSSLQQEPPPPARPVQVPQTVLSTGEQLYGSHCAECHGKSGEGVAGRFPALAGNRALSLGDPSNVVQTILHGGFLPATSGNPRPFGMPPFMQTLDDTEVAAVASYVRGAWGNTGFAVEPLDVYQLKNADVH